MTLVHIKRSNQETIRLYDTIRHISPVKTIPSVKFVWCSSRQLNGVPCLMPRENSPWDFCLGGGLRSLTTIDILLAFNSGRISFRQTLPYPTHCNNSSRAHIITSNPLHHCSSFLSSSRPSLVWMLPTTGLLTTEEFFGCRYRACVRYFLCV